MAFYDLSKPERISAMANIAGGILNESNTDKLKKLSNGFLTTILTFENLPI